jgi:hypothetical protein
MATALKEKMRRAECPNCGWTGHVDPTEDTWLTTCPRCKNPDGDNVNLLPLLHIPYDKNLFTELNLERYEMTKTGKLLFNHPQGTHDDRFWALALAVYAAENSNPPSRPLAKII